MLVSILFSSAVVIVVYKFVLFLIEWKRDIDLCKKIPCIGPAHWFWGHINQFTSLPDKVDKEREMIKNQGAKVFHTWYGPFHAVIGVLHHDAAKDIMKSTEPKPMFKDTDGYSFLKSWVGMGLILSHGKRWERNRRLLTPAFHFDILKPYVQIYNDVVDTFLKNIKLKQDSDKTIDIYPLVTLATLDTMLRCAFSYTGGIQTESSHPYVAAVRRMSELLVHRYFNPLVHRKWIYDLTASGREYNKLTKYVHTFAENIIASRKQSLKEDPEQLNRRRLDFLDILLSAKDDDGNGLSDEEIRSEVSTFLLGGHETTASAISWAFYYLGKYPEEQHKVYEEVHDLIDGSEFFAWDNISQCRQMSLFVKESLRHTSPVPGVARYITKPFVLDGIELPAGTTVGICINHINNNPHTWPDYDIFCTHPKKTNSPKKKEKFDDMKWFNGTSGYFVDILNDDNPYYNQNKSHSPELTLNKANTNILPVLSLDLDNDINNGEIQTKVFRPERFLEAESRQRDPFAFVPFSAGSRNCIGQNFAQHELKVFIARIISRYKISLVDGFEYEQEPGTITRAKHGIKLHMEERQK